jgi:phage I-like protein
MKETAVHPTTNSSSASERLNELSRVAGRTVAEAQVGAAEALENAASSVRTSARHGSEAIDNLAERAAGKLDSTAARVRSPDLETPVTTLGRFIRRHSTASLILGAAIGLFAGSAVWRRVRAAHNHV